MHQVAQTFRQRIPDSPRLFVRIDLANELEKLIIGLFGLECRCDKVRRFEGFDADDVNGV
jgi:hypothetical protein